MPNKEELIRAAETFIVFCDSHKLCDGCPIIGSCGSTYLAEMMRDIKQNLIEVDYD